MKRHFLKGRSNPRQHPAPPAHRAKSTPATRARSGQSASRLHGWSSGRNPNATLEAISLGICPPVSGGTFNTAEIKL